MTQEEKEVEKLKLQYEGLMLEYDFIKQQKNNEIEKQKQIIEDLQNKNKSKEEEIESTNKSLQLSFNEMAFLKNTIQDLKSEVEATKESYECSLSWKITKPLRKIKKIIKRK